MFSVASMFGNVVFPYCYVPLSWLKGKGINTTRREEVENIEERGKIEKMYMSLIGGQANQGGGVGTVHYIQ